MNTITMDMIKDGRCQFNATSAKSFRATLAKWHDATFRIADELLAKNDRVKNLRGLISSNAALIEKLDNGESIIGNKTKNSLQSEIDAWNLSIESENAAMDEFRTAQKSRLEKGNDLVTKSLYESVMLKDESSTLAIAQFLSDNGIEPCMDTINLILAAIGKRTNSARNMCKTGNHNGNISYAAFTKIFLGEICDMMGDALPKFKFTYVLKDNRKSEK